MKPYFKKIIALLLISTQAYAGLPPTSTQGQSDTSPKTKFNFQAPFNQITDLGGIKSLVETGNGNILPDPGFEAATSGWTCSGGSDYGAYTAAVGTGKLGYDWNSNSASQTLVSAQVTIPPGYQGKNGLFACNIKTVSGTATHTIAVWDGANNISTPITITNSTTTFVQTLNNFIFPSSSTIGIRITAINSNEPEIYVDDCKITLADNIGTVAQAILVDAVTVTGCTSNWGTTSATFSSFNTSTPTGCVYTSAKGVASAPTGGQANLPAFKFASLPAGDYKIEYEGGISESSTGAGFFQFTDGTNTAREIAVINSSGGAFTTTDLNQSISYSSPQSNVTLELKGHTTSGTLGANGSTTYPGVFKLWYFPSSSQQAFNAQTSAASWSGSTTLTGTTASASMADPGSVSGSVTTLFNRNITCVVNGSSKMGIDCTLPRTGSYLVCYSGSKAQSLAVASSSVQLTDGAGNVIIGAQYGSSFATGAPSPMSGCSTYLATSTSATFKLMGLASAGSGTLTLNPTGFSVTGIDQSLPAPILIHSVTSNSAGAVRTESLAFGGSSSYAACTTGTCTTISTTSTGWGTVTYNSTGNYTLTYTGAFSAPPMCTITTNSTVSAFVIASWVSVPTTTSTDLLIKTDAGSSTNGAAVISCKGAR